MKLIPACLHMRVRRTAVKVMQAGVLALLVAVSIPGRAADQRAVKSRVAPVYPELAKRMRITGAVVVEATVDPEGKVTAVKAVSGNRALSQAAEDAVQKWRFVSADSISKIDVELNFSLGQ